MAAILVHREGGATLVGWSFLGRWHSGEGIDEERPTADRGYPPHNDPGAPPGPTVVADPASLTAAKIVALQPQPQPQCQGRHPGPETDECRHRSVTDARLYRKSLGTGAMLCFIGHALMENCSGLIVPGALTRADGWPRSC